MTPGLDGLRSVIGRVIQRLSRLRGERPGEWSTIAPGSATLESEGDEEVPDRARPFELRVWLSTNRRLAFSLAGALLGVVTLVGAITGQHRALPPRTHARAGLPPSFAKLTPDNPFEDHARLQEEKLRQKEKQLQELTGRMEHLSTELEAVRRTAEEAKSSANDAAVARTAKEASAPAPDAATSHAGRIDLAGLAKQISTLSSDRARAASASAADHVQAGIARPPAMPPAVPPTKPENSIRTSVAPGGNPSGLDPVDVGASPAQATPPVDRFGGGIRFASRDFVRAPAAVVARKGPFVLQAGAFARGRVLFGLDAPTDATHDQAPAIAIEAIDTFKGPNSGSTPLTGCMFLGSARGDFSSARVVVKITTISCTFGDLPLEREITGIVIGPDDKSGVPGELVDHLLEKASWATLAGVGEGTAEAFKQGATTQVVSGLTGSVTSVVDPRKVGQYAAASGASGAARQIGSVALDRIEKLAPYVSINGGETVWIYVLKGTELEGLDEWIATTRAPNDG